LSKLDGLIRKHLNDLIGGTSIVERFVLYFLEVWRFGIKNLRKRYAVLKLNNNAHFYLRNDETREFIEWQMEEEARDRKIQVESNMKGNYFFDWQMMKRREMRGKYHSIIFEAFKAASILQVGINYDAEENKILVWENDKIHKCGKGQVASKLSEMLVSRHYEELCRQPTRGQSMVTLKDSAVSNFFIGNCRGPTND
jgi:hypothetical protein